MAILEPGTTSGPPPAAQLEAAALELRRRGELRLLIGLVERWSQVGMPTQRARLAQVEALLDLRMMDRAWTRLQALDDDESLDRIKLTARMFLVRGWHGRARDVLTRAKTMASRDPEVLALIDAAARSPRPPPLHAPSSSAPVEEQLSAVESFLAAGAYLKARRLLESLEQTHPHHPRVGDLIWALQGDYDLMGTTLRHLVAHYVGNIGGTDLPDLSEDADTTDQTAADFAMPLGPAEGPDGFPSLFRHGRDQATAEADAETTQATRMEDIAAAVAGRGFHDSDEDTQILRIVNASMRTDAHAAIQTPVAPDEIEEEDDVVVLVRQNHAQPPPTTRRPLPAPRSEDAESELPEITDLEPEEIEEIEDLGPASIEPVDPAPGLPPETLKILLVAAVLMAVTGLALVATLLFVALA